MGNILHYHVAFATLALCCSSAMVAQTGELAETPPMGWNSWNHFACKVSDPIIRAQADAMVSNGMKAAGYEYVNIDDCWQGQRDSAGRIHPNKRFPDMKALAEYVHLKGLKIWNIFLTWTENLRRI